MGSLETDSLDRLATVITFILQGSLRDAKDLIGGVALPEGAPLRNVMTQMSALIDRLSDEFLSKESALATVQAATWGLEAAKDVLRKDEARFRATLGSIGEGLIATDARGCIEFMNPVAEQLTGWATEDASGRPSGKVFSIVDARTRAEVESPAGRVSREGVIVSLADHTLLVARDGAERQIAGECAPIRDDAAQIHGAVVVFRDVTEEYRRREQLRDAEERYHNLVETANDWIWEIDTDGVITFSSTQVIDILGYGPEEFVGRDPSHLMSPEEAQRVGAALGCFIAARAPIRGLESTLAHRDGHEVTLESNATPFFSADGELLGYRGVDRDITARKRAEERVRESEERYRDLVKATSDWVWEVDTNGVYTYASPQGSVILGIDPAKVVGRSAFDFMPPQEAQRQAELFARHVAAGTPIIGLETANIHKDGHEVILETSAVPFFSPDGAVLGYRGYDRDITDRKRSEELLQSTLDALERSHLELLELASHDSLTGLLNRRRFEEEFERQIAEQQRLGRGGAVIWLDLDHFKDVNDTLGHRAGDELLMLVARTLRAEMRAYSVIARLGGDEFAVILPAAGQAEALAAAERLIRVLAEREFALAGHAVHAAASIGVALYPDHGATVQELLAASDVAMYHAKESGRGRVSLYEPEQGWAGESASRTLWGEKIRAALAEDRLVLHAQPIRGLTSESSAEYELLVRMLADDGELIAPLEFIPAAERLGLIGEIDRWVVRHAIRLLAAEEAAGEPTRLAVNLSGRTLSDVSILDVFREEFTATGADPSRLTVEVTETAVVSNIAEAGALVRGLHELGCRFSMDDFGTGASSFYYLRHLPVDVLKIDGSLVKGMGVEPADEKFIRAIVQMCEALHITSVAEYVENGSTLTEVRDAGVDCVQGFLVGKPKPLGVYLKSQKT